MAKFLFAGPGQYLICTKCRSILPTGIEFSEDGDLDFPWCETCMGFATPKVMDGGQ